MSDTHATGPDPAAAKKLAENPTRSYRPGASWSAGLATAGMDGSPWFTWMDVPRMLRDPRVRFLERMWRSPFQRVKFNVASDDPRVARYAGRTLRKFWSESLPRILSRYFRFGFGCGGAEFTAARGQVVLDQVRVVEALDARPLAWADGPDKGLPAGFAAPGVARVLAPHAVWFAGQAEVSPWYDMPPIAGAFEPWAEKRGRNGAVASRRLWYWKNAVRGGGLYYPPGRSNIGTDETPQWIDNQDLARQVMDYTENGSTMIFENTQHPANDALKAWEYKPPESFPDRAGLREYPGDLDKEMAEGVGIPPEVLEASEVGSGWSGRMVPMETWLGGVDEFVGLAYKAFGPTLKYAVAANYGRGAYFHVQPVSLVDQVRQQAQAGPGGGEGKNPVPGLLGKGGDDGGGDDEPKPKKLSGGWEPYSRRNGKKGLRNPVTHRYRELSGSGRVPKSVRRKVKELLAARDLSDGRAGGQHAPKGGVTIGGTTYPGGRFIPGEVIDQATPAEKAALDGKGADGGKPEKLPAKAVSLAGRVLAKGAAAAGKAEHVLKDAVLAAHAKLPAGLRGVVGAAFRLSMAGFDAGQAAATAAALDRGVSPEAVAKVGHLLAIADVAMFKGTKAMALLGIPGGKLAFAVAGSLPVASLCYLGYSAAANPVRTAKAALAAVKAALKDTGGKSWADAKSVPSDFAGSVKKLARYSGIGNPALALSDGRGEGEGLEAFMAEVAAADPARADWLVACFAGALAETNGDRDAAAGLAVQAAGNGGEPGGGRTLSATPDDDDGSTQGPADTDDDGLVDQRPLQLLAYVAALVQEKFAAKGKPERAAHYLDQLAELASDPDRLGELLGGVELSWSPYEGPKGGHGFKNDETGRIIYGKHKPGDRKAARAATVAERTKLAGEAKEAAKRIAAGGADPSDVEALTATIPNMTVAQLRDTRAALGAKLGTQWRDNMAKKLLAHVRERVEKARDEPEAKKPEEKDVAAKAAPPADPPKTAAVDAVAALYDRAATAEKAEIDAAKAQIAALPAKDRKALAAKLEMFGNPSAADIHARILDRWESATRSKLVGRAAGTPEPDDDGPDDPYAGVSPEARAAGDEHDLAPSATRALHTAARQHGLDPAVLAAEAVRDKTAKTYTRPGKRQGTAAVTANYKPGDVDVEDIQRAAERLKAGGAGDGGGGRSAAGPKEGDKNAEGLTLRSGRWVREGGSGAAAASEAVKTAGPTDVKPGAAQKPDDPAYVAAGKALLTNDTFRKNLADAYNHQTLFVEHRDGLVPLDRIYHEFAKRQPGVTIPQFQAAMDQLSRDRGVQLHVLNETKGVPANERLASIHRNDRLYHFATFGGPGKADPERMRPVGGGAARHPVADKLAGALKAAPGLSDEQRAAYGKAAEHVLGRMPPAARDRLDRHVIAAHFHTDNAAVGRAVAAEVEAINPAKAAELRQIIDDGGQIGGAFVARTGTLHTDGGLAAGGQTTSANLPENTAPHVYAHEWAHAVDGPGFELSRSPTWQAAFEAEFGGGRLTKYASSSPSEAFAEFARLVWASPVPAAKVEAAFPKAVAAWKEAGLWPA